MSELATFLLRLLRPMPPTSSPPLWKKRVSTFSTGTSGGFQVCFEARGFLPRLGAPLIA